MAPPAETPPATASRWSDLRLRVASAGVLLPVALLCLFAGGLAWLAPALTLVAGGLYLLVGAASLHWLRSDATVGLIDVLFLLVVVWSSDIGAYVVGRLVGGPKLAPSISPGKTWSGALGGLVCAMVLGLAVSRFAAPGPVLHALVVAGALSVASQLGDLLESGLKRHFGVKDSSQLIPGHGGVFDRLDGVLAAAPVALLLALALGRGVEMWR